VPFPLVGQINDQPRTRGKAGHREEIVQNSVLLIPITWLSQSVTKWPVQIEHTWRFHLGSQFSYQCQRNGSYPVSLNFSCEQSHGPRAGRSGRYQHNEINTGLSQRRSDLAPLHDYHLWVIYEAETVMDIGHTPNNTFSL